MTPAASPAQSKCVVLLFSSPPSVLIIARMTKGEKMVELTQEGGMQTGASGLLSLSLILYFNCIRPVIRSVLVLQRTARLIEPWEKEMI